jgi:Predicted membrane protein (DUF2207) C-terminal domain
LLEQNPYILILPFLFMGLVIFAIQLTAIYILLRPFRRDPVDPTPSSPLSGEPPAGISPAEAGCLAVPGCRVGWSQALGCLFDLAADGRISIQQIHPRKSQDQPPGFRLHLAGTLADLRAFERGLLEALFLVEAGLEQEVTLEEAAGRFAARAGRFKRPLLAALRNKDLIDPARENALNYLRLTVRFASLAGAAGLVIGIWFALTGGWWAVWLVPAGFLAGALVTSLQASSFSICTDRGRESAGRWLVYTSSLAQAGLPACLESAQENQQLAYLAALGRLRVWMGQVAPGTLASPPGWFQTVPEEERLGQVFMDFLAAASELSGEPGSNQEILLATS